MNTTQIQQKERKRERERERESACVSFLNSVNGIVLLVS